MSITDRVKNWISKDISDGLYPPGTKMPTRMDLMKKYNIARASVDKVIRTLVKEGLLASTQGSGTYVLDRREAKPHLYVVLNTEAECEEATSFHSKLSLMLASVSTDVKCTIVGSREFDKNFSEVLQNSLSRVIWSRPSIKSYGYIATLDKANIAQILVNRPIPAYSYISTDTQIALRSAFECIQKQVPHARMGLLVPRLDLEESFLSEREIFFHQMLYEHEFSLKFFGRAPNKSTREILTQVRAALDKVDEMDFLFVPDFYMVPFVITLADERGIELGKDLSLLTIDWDEDAHTKGIICLKQNWDEMFQKALDWAQHPTVEKMQELIAPEVIENY